MNKVAKEFISSLRAQLSPDAIDLAHFITTETYIKGQKFSFEGHEYQEYIVNLVKNNPGCTFVIKKCSQIGLSEIFMRIILARMAVRPGTAALISFPSKLLAQEVLKTRVANIISESPKLTTMLNNDIDSASVKALRNTSIMYALGGSKQSNTSLLNRPICTVLCDELDRQDENIVTGYHSRMTHTKEIERIIAYISTPTVADIGIDSEFKQCRITHHPYTVCNHCGHEFQPDYYEHIKIPGYDESLLLLTKTKAATLDLSLTYLECPECKGNIDKPTVTWREEVNPLGTAGKIGVELTPFTAHSFISPASLVRASLTYKSHTEFLNQGLGRVALLKDSTIQREFIHFESLEQAPAVRIFGLDLGKLCHFMEGRLNSDTSIHVDAAHVIKLSELEDFLDHKCKQTVFSAGVIDSQPYSDLVYRLVKKYPQLYSAIYISPSTPIPELFKLSMHDKHGEVVRQVSINKSPMMDLMANSLDAFFTFEPGPMEGAIVKHLLDMRRVRDYRFEEMIYQWIKSKEGDDHFFHSLVYMFTASKLVTQGVNISMEVPVTVHKFKLTELNNQRRV